MDIIFYRGGKPYTASKEAILYALTRFDEREPDKTLPIYQRLAQTLADNYELGERTEEIYKARVTKGR